MFPLICFPNSKRCFSEISLKLVSVVWRFIDLPYSCMARKKWGQHGSCHAGYLSCCKQIFSPTLTTIRNPGNCFKPLVGAVFFLAQVNIRMLPID